MYRQAAVNYSVEKCISLSPDGPKLVIQQRAYTGTEEPSQSGNGSHTLLSARQRNNTVFPFAMRRVLYLAWFPVFT